MEAEFAVIIPHYNDVARLRRCLAALVPQGRDDVDLVVVDNGSVESLEQIRAEFPRVRIEVEQGKGAALARNKGVSATRAPNLIFLDADCVPAPDWFSAARNACGRSDIVGGAIDLFDETPGPRSGAEAVETVFAFRYKDYIEKKGFSVTANLATTRRVFDAVGPFVNGLSEDAEWCFRARAKGFRLILDEAMRVAHPTRSDWPALARKWRRITNEMFALHIADHPGFGGRALWAMRALATAASGAAHLPRLILSRELNGLGERLRGAGTLVRLRLLRSFWMLGQAAGRQI